MGVEKKIDKADVPDAVVVVCSGLEGVVLFNVWGETLWGLLFSSGFPPIPVSYPFSVAFSPFRASKIRHEKGTFKARRIGSFAIIPPVCGEGLRRGRRNGHGKDKKG